MFDVEDKLAKSLTADTKELIPYLPYILQDLWTLGSSPIDIELLLKQHCRVNPKTKIIDLACGKGAVSIHLAKKFKCYIKGVDILADFIRFAKQKAIDEVVEEFCCFEQADINDSIKNERGYDIVILGATGDILGNPKQTLEKLKRVLNKTGFIVIDDAYSNNDTVNYTSQSEWYSYFDQLNLSMLAEISPNQDELKKLNTIQQKHIKKRAEELIAIYPSKANMFKDYIKSQQAECEEIENDIKCVTWLLKTNEMR